MWETARALFAAAAVNLRSTWRSFAMTDLAYKAIAFAVLMPATSWLIYWVRAGTSHRVIADVDIARFFITTPAGIVTLIVGTSMILAITALEIACLMGISLGNAKGVRLNTRSALRFGRARSLDVLRLIGHMVVRVLAGVAPFALAVGLVYLTLLREHDINYYLC